MKKIKKLSALFLILCIILGSLSAYAPLAVQMPFTAFDGTEQLNVTSSGEEVCGNESRPVYMIEVTPDIKTVTVKGLVGAYLFKNGCDWENWSSVTENQTIDVLPDGEYYHIEGGGLCNVFAHIRFSVTSEERIVNIKASVQTDNTYYFPPFESFEITSGLAKKYGYEYGDGIKTGNVTALDALVAAHLKIYDECDENLLLVSKDGYVTKVFGVDTYNFGFTVNGKMPLTDVWHDDYEYYDGYTVNNCVLSEDDQIEFFLYQDPNAMDNYTWFEQDGNKKSSVAATVNQPFSLTLRGYCIGWYGASDDATIESMTENIVNAQIVLLDEYGAASNMEGTLTDENGSITLNFDEAGKYTVSAVSTAESGYILMPLVTVNVFEQNKLPTFDYSIQNTIGVPDDWQNDLWLQYDFKELCIGDKADIFPRRIPEIISNSVTNDTFRPQFNFEIISGDSITMNKTKTDDKTTVTAVKPGVTVVKVTYDTATYKSETYGASADINSAYVVYDVGDSMADVTIDSQALNQISSYDTLYFTNGDTTLLDIDATAISNSQAVTDIVVTCNGVEVVKGDNNQYLLPLLNASNIIGIHAATADGKIKNFFKVVDARKIEINIKNTTGEDKSIKINDKVEISFKGISNPVPKIAGFYNPTWYSEQFGNKGSYVHYNNNELNTVKGYCNQWDLADKNTISITFDKAGVYNFTGGKIFSQWWGQILGKDKTEETLPTDTNAVQYEAEFCTLPDFTISVAAQESDYIPVTSVLFDKTSLTMKKGESLTLNAAVLPPNATDKGVTYRSDNTYFATVSGGGVVTALHANTDKVPQVTITATSADGKHSARCVVVISDESSSGTISGDNAKLVNTQTSKAEILSGKIAEIGQLIPTNESMLSQFAADSVIAVYREFNALSAGEQTQVKGYDKILQAIEVIGKANRTCEYGISLENTAWNIKLNCQPLGMDIGELDKFRNGLKEDVKMLSAFKLSVTDILTGNEPEDGGSYTLCFDPSLLNGYEHYLIVQRKEDGTFEYLEPVIEKGIAKVTADTFSAFAVAGYNENAANNLDVAEKSGHVKPIIPLLFISAGICAIIVLLAAFAVSKFKKRG